MPLRPPGKNPPIDDASRRMLFALGRAVDLVSTPPRTENIDVRGEGRSYTLEEMSRLLEALRVTRVHFLELPWDERHASTLADRALALIAEDARTADPQLAAVLLAGGGRFDEARAVYDRIGQEQREQYAHASAHAALAVGDFDVPANKLVRQGRLTAIGSIVRFRPIVDRIAAAAGDLLAALPDFFAGSVYPQYLEIWSPTLRAFALLAQSDDKTLDSGYAALVDELAAVRVSNDEGFTPENKRAALRTMFRLAIHQNRLVSAHRIATKFGKRYTDRYRRTVAVEYAKVGDLGGAWEIVRKMPPSTGRWYDELAQTLQDHAGEAAQRGRSS